MQQQTIRRLISVGILIALAVFFALTGEYFLSWRNIIAILREASIIGIISVGVTYAIITGGIDLSTGSIVALVGMTMANYYKYTALPIWLMLVLAIVVGLIAGFSNGYIITKFNIPEFIATLATLEIFRSLTYIIAIKEFGMITSQPMRDAGFVSLDGQIGGIYYVIFIFLVFIILGQLILKKTRFGTYIYAVGTNRKSAELAGINTNKVRVLVFTITGFCCAIGAIFICARMQSATAVMGAGMEFSVIAAVVVGGCALSGGRGDIFGSAIGALFMAVLDNGIYKFQVNTATQSIIKGLIIVLVVVFDVWYLRRAKDKMQKNKLRGGA